MFNSVMPVKVETLALVFGMLGSLCTIRVHNWHDHESYAGAVNDMDYSRINCIMFGSYFQR
jgi:hypothetical protein